jgi:hypothetical protein
VGLGLDGVNSHFPLQRLGTFVLVFEGRSLLVALGFNASKRTVTEEESGDRNQRGSAA